MARIEITAESSAQGYWIHIDTTPVPMTNGFGSVVVPPGQHLLHWSMLGKAGDTVSVTVTEGDQVLAAIIKDPIPAGWETGGGVEPFSTRSVAVAATLFAAGDRQPPKGWSVGRASQNAGGA